MNLPDPVKRAVYLLSFILTCLLPINLLSQQATWGLNIGGNSVDYVQSSHIDATGNVYICGEFRGTNVDFDPSAATAFSSSNGQCDAFVAKYTSDGQYLMSITIGGGNLDKITAVATDNAGNIYITGYFRGANVDFDPSASTAFLTSNGDNGSDPGYGGDIFVAKYTATGQYLWAFHVGGSSLGDSGLTIRTDAAGNIFLGGYFRETIDFNPSAAVNTLNASTGTAFLARYSTSGQYQWAFNFGAPDIDNVIFDIRLDASNNIYVTGFYQGNSIDFDPSAATVLLNSNGNFEGYVAKYNANGQLVFAFSIGGSGLDTGRGLILDNAGNIYVVGDFNGTNIDFDPSPGSALLSSNGASDVFIAKYSNTGQYVWAINVGSTGGEICWKIATDNTSIFITGGFSGVADFNPGPVTDNLTTNGGSDVFLAKYDMSGNYQCAFNLGSSGNDNGFDILMAGTDRFYLSGGFQGTNVDFTPTQSTYLMNSAGSDDAFLVKYYWPPNTLPTGTIQGNTICETGTGQLTFTSLTGTSPFTIQYSDGVSAFTQTNVQSGIPFNVQVSPVSTTNYSILFINDGVRCSPVNNNLLTATITVDRNPSVVTTNDMLICSGTPVQLNTTGAQTYSWTPGTSLTNASIPDPVATPVVSTQYIVTGTSTSGCTAKDTVNINIHPVPVISISNDTTICKNSSLQLFVTGGQSYVWTPPATINNPVSATPVVSPLNDTRYYVSITGINTCVYKDSVQINIRPDAVFTLSDPRAICLNDSVRLIAGGGDTYNWQPAVSLSNNSIANPWAFPVAPTNYSVTITDLTCNESATLSVDVDVLTLPIVQAVRSNDIDCSNDQSQLIANGAALYSWQPAITLSNPSTYNPIATPVVTTDYTVKGTDTQGCSAYDTIKVQVTDANKSSYLMPTAFTPNNDGLNDCYRVRYWGIVEELEFSIYNRWGERVFFTTSRTNCWNGIYKGIPQNPGVFVYMIKAKTNCETAPVFRKGTFMLIR
jgi:gliding motility-associated-like protein